MVGELTIGTFQPTGPLTVARGGAGAAVLPNGDVLVFGDDNLQLGPDAVPTVKTPVAEVSR